MWDLAEDNLTRGEVNNKLFATDHKGRTFLHLATLNNELEVLQKLGVWAKYKLTTEDISKKLLFARHHNGSTIWNCATGLWRTILLQKLLEWAKEKLRAGEITKELFFSHRS